MTQTLKIPDAHLWSPEDPFLYVVESSTGGDSFETRFGMREFKFDAATRRAYLNGKIYYLRGSNITLHRFLEDPLCRDLPNNREGRIIGDQMLRSATSTASNYRAACRARSRADFISKLGIVEEEADETMFWLEFITELAIIDATRTAPLMKENDEILAMIVSSIKTARENKE